MSSLPGTSSATGEVRWSASYMRLRSCPDGGVARTVDLGNSAFLDLDGERRALGIEAVGRVATMADVLAALLWFGGGGTVSNGDEAAQADKETP